MLDAVIDGSSVRRGEVIALDRSARPLARDGDPARACLAALAATEADGVELVTIHRGEGVPDEGAATLAECLAAAGPGVEVEVIPGGQPGDACLVAVE